MTTVSVFESNLFFDQYIEETHFRGFSVGYELSEFRYDELVELFFDALPDFALSELEKQSINSFNMRRKMKNAAIAVYTTEKYQRRGEFGEILLHIVMRDYFQTIPAISKIYYKDGPNETVKGFDAVHIVPQGNELELWLGEVKFYNNIYNAITDVVIELQAHSNKDYLRKEFLFISNKIDDSWEFASNLKALINQKTSLDKIFSRVRIPVLLTYDSKVVKSYKKACDEYQQKLIDELNKYHQNFRSSDLPKDIDIVLILVPLEKKETLVEKLHTKLRVWQQI